MDNFYFSTEKLTVGYQGVPLIRDIEIQLARGEILTLIGPNGAGKTTILCSIIRQLEPICGVVCLDGKKIRDMGRNEMARKMSAVLTERVRPEMMTCSDVVATGRYPYTGKFGILSEQDRQVVNDSMEQVDILELRDRDFRKISDGQKQRVLLARALCQEPDVLVLDEPTSFLDIRYKLEFLAIIQKMARTKGLSVLMSLHELDLAGRISDKIACVKGDKIDRFGTPEEIFAGEYIPQLYQMTQGTYDELTGSLELPAAKGRPRVFVIAGNGTGTQMFRKLQRDGIPFAAGILWENDVDCGPAMALASEVVKVGAFRKIEKNHLDRAKELIAQCEQVVCTLSERELRDCPEELRTLALSAEDRARGSAEE